MKLNLLPGYIRQAKRNRNALFLMVIFVLATLLAFGYWTISVKQQLAEAQNKDRELTPQAEEVVRIAASADQIYQDNAILFRNVELTWYITEHNKKYPRLYRKMASLLPSYMRLVSMSAGDIDVSKGAEPVWPGMSTSGATPTPPPQPQQPSPGPPQGGLTQQVAPQPTGASTCTVRMRAVLGNYAQYSDMMIALLRDRDFVLQVARSGFDQNQTGFEGLEGMGGPAAVGAGGLGGETSAGGRPAPPGWSTVDVVCQVRFNLVPPNPRNALMAAATGGGAGAASGFAGGAAPPSGMMPGPPGPGPTMAPGPGPTGPGPAAGPPKAGTAREDR
ncbi:MAG: hypothetical protein AMXMBFR61_08890 [Fimbriimonadales bacterium]